MASESHERKGDMHPTRKLKITLQRGGDVIVSIIQDGSLIEESEPGSAEDRKSMVEFCANGGKSHRVRVALADLAAAIKIENEESAQ